MTKTSYKYRIFIIPLPTPPYSLPNLLEEELQDVNKQGYEAVSLCWDSYHEFYIITARKEKEQDGLSNAISIPVNDKRFVHDQENINE